MGLEQDGSDARVAGGGDVLLTIVDEQDVIRGVGEHVEHRLEETRVGFGEPDVTRVERMVECSGVAEFVGHVPCPMRVLVGRKGAADSRLSQFGREQVAEEPVDVGVRVEHRGEGVPPFHGRVLDHPVGVEQDGRDGARLQSCWAFHARYWAKVSSSGG